MKVDKVYVLLTRMAKAMKVSYDSVKEWGDKGYFDVYLVGGQKMLLRQDAILILRGWKRTCTPTEAAKIIGVKQGTIYGYIARGILDHIKMFQYRRVVISSIHRGKEYFDSTTERLHKKSVDMGHSPGCHRFTREEAEMLSEKKKKLSLVTNGKLVSKNQTASILGVQKEELSRLPIRSKWIDGEEYFFAHSVEIYKSRKMSTKNKKTSSKK